MDFTSPGATANPGQMVNVRWNHHSPTLISSFSTLLQYPKYSDVTLTCEGESIRCHRVILAACSVYFKGVFDHNEAFSVSNATGGIIIFINDLKLWQLKAIITFLYQGSVDIFEVQLPQFMEAAKFLHIDGLTSGRTMEGINQPLPRGQGQGRTAQGHRSSGVHSKTNYFLPLSTVAVPQHLNMLKRQAADFPKGKVNVAGSAAAVSPGTMKMKSSGAGKRTGISQGQTRQSQSQGPPSSSSSTLLKVNQKPEISTNALLMERMEKIKAEGTHTTLVTSPRETLSKVPARTNPASKANKKVRGVEDRRGLGHGHQDVIIHPEVIITEEVIKL